MLQVLIGVINDSFEKIYEKYCKLVFRICKNILENADTAASATQDVFVKISKHLDGLSDSRTKLKNWIAYIAKTTAIDYYRKTKNIPETPVALDDYCEPYQTPEHIYLTKECLEEVKDEFEKLSPTEQDVLKLSLYFNMTVPQIAKLRNMNTNTVYSHIHRAREKLKRRIYAYWGGAEREK